MSSPTARAYSREAEQKKLSFPFGRKNLARAKSEMQRKFFLRGRPPLRGGWRRASFVQEFLIK